MVIDTRYNFLVFAQVVDEWNEDKRFNDGLLLFEIGGDLFPKEIINMTLNMAIPMLADALSETEEDEALFSMEKDEAVRQLIKITFPCKMDMDNDFRFLIKIFEMQDRDYYFFSVRKGDDVRILAAKVDYDSLEEKFKLDSIYVRETYIPDAELKKISEKLREYYAGIR